MRARKKHPCPDCHVCQWCSDARCAACQGWLVKDKAKPCKRGACGGSAGKARCHEKK